MGLIRWAAIIGTGGLAPVKANSAKERTAKAAEASVLLERRQRHAAAAAPAPARFAVTPADGPSPGQFARQARRASRLEAPAPDVHEQLDAIAVSHVARPEPQIVESAGVVEGLARLAGLHSAGALSDEEFAAAKARILET